MPKHSSHENIHSKHVRFTNQLDENCISNLPDEVICHVLSCLPTKDAVRTSVLSQQWNSKCIYFYGVDVDFNTTCTSLHVEAKFSSFPSFRKKQDAHDDVMIRRFHLVIGDSLETRNEPGILTIGLLRSLSSSASLTTLKIKLNCSVQLPAENCFPNLKSLYLDAPECESIDLVDERSYVTYELSLTFPALEVLELRRCTFSEVALVNIKVPRLIRFSVDILYQCKDNYKIKIYGPAIVEFSLSDWKESKIVAERASDLLKGAPSLKRLKLVGAVAEALVKWKGTHALPAFDRLELLELCCHPEEWVGLLQEMPCLESLKIDMSEWYKYKHEVPFPPCISINLKEVEFVKFYGETSQMSCVKMLLKFVNSLKRVTVRLGEKSVRTKSEIRHQLSTFLPKKSSCVIDVI